MNKKCQLEHRYNYHKCLNEQDEQISSIEELRLKLKTRGKAEVSIYRIRHSTMKLCYRVSTPKLLSNSISNICLWPHVWLKGIIRQFGSKI